MNTIIELLKNKKMYGVAIVVIIIGVAEGLLGLDVPGIDVGDDWLGYILTGLGIGATKAAIAKTGTVY